MSSIFLKNSYVLALLTFFAFLFLVINLVDVFLDFELSIIFIVLLSIILVILIIYIYAFYYKKTKLPTSIEEFEKTLKGGLFHFKCPVCNGIFAIKKSRANNNKIVKMNCPDCGAIGVIPKNPTCIIDDIPEKKSIKANFRCFNCGEGITVWAEGTDLFFDTKVYSCPFCGTKKILRKF